ncbi:hypothetical protein PG990_014579 [Apiospora arundinis]
MFNLRNIVLAIAVIGAAPLAAAVPSAPGQTSTRASTASLPTESPRARPWSSDRPRTTTQRRCSRPVLMGSATSLVRRRADAKALNAKQTRTAGSAKRVAR